MTLQSSPDAGLNAASSRLLPSMALLKVVAMDVTDAESVRNAAMQLKDFTIDVLINSAGIAGVPGQKTGTSRATPGGRRDWGPSILSLNFHSAQRERQEAP